MYDFISDIFFIAVKRKEKVKIIIDFISFFIYVFILIFCKIDSHWLHDLLLI